MDSSKASKLVNSSNKIDLLESPGLDKLFAKFDKEVISSEKVNKPTLSPVPKTKDDEILELSEGRD